MGVAFPRRMKTLIFIILSFCSAAHAQDLILSLGEQKRIPLQSSSVWIEKKNVIQAHAESSSLVLRGLAPGSTLLRVNGKTQNVQVVDPLHFQSYEKLHRACQDMLGLKVEFTKGFLAVRGQLYRWKDWQKLSSLNLRFAMQARISSALQEQAQSEFERMMSKAKIPTQSLIFASPVEIRIHPKSLYREKYQDLFAPYGIQVALDQDSIETLPTVKVQITVAEIKRASHMKLGIRWPQTYSASILRTGEYQLDNLPLTADVLESRGYGKILASPNIVCRSGKEAEFLVGGEFPIKILGYKAQSIIWKKYGILLKVQPKADAAGRMSISLETEISTFDTSRSVDGVPGLFTNRVSSHFDLSRPKTIALSGLIKNQDGKSKEGLPYLSRLPILGTLFSSEDFLEDRTELVIFVRPTILENELSEETSPTHLAGVK